MWLSKPAQRSRIHSETSSKITRMCFLRSCLKGVPPAREVEHAIETDPEAVPPSRAPYRLGPKEIEEMEEQIKTSSVRATSAHLTVPMEHRSYSCPKRTEDGGCVLTTGCSTSQTKKDKYPIPRVDELIDKLGSARYFTKLDLASGYHQIAMKAEDVHKTSVQDDPRILRIFGDALRANQCSCNLSKVDEQDLKKELGKFICVYLDDILIFSKTLEEHISHVRIALERLRTAKLYGRLHKCEFFRKTVEYLGYIVSSEGVKASEEKIRAIIDWPQPTSVQRCLQFSRSRQLLQEVCEEFFESGETPH